MFRSGNFSKQKVTARLLGAEKFEYPVMTTPRGVNNDKKTDLMNKVVKFMAPNRRTLWRDYSVYIIDNGGLF